MKKTLTTTILILIMYGIPLAGKPDAILTVKIFVCAIGAAILFMSQPAMNAREAKDKRSTDRNSIYAILIAALAGQITSVVEWAYVMGDPMGIRNPFIAGLGLAMITGGLWFRLWAIHTLGKFFTATVQIKTDHRVVDSGPYRLVRHPSYLGALIAVVGSGLFLEATIGTVVCVVTMLAAYWIRIGAEEIALVNALGDAYKVYQRRTKRLIPLIW